MSSNLLYRFVLSFLAVGISLVSHAKIVLPKVIADGMVIQRNQRVKIWGWADPSERVSITFRGEKYRAKADQGGEWSIMLKEGNAGGPFKMSISGSNDVVLSNILVGDVWLCTGQSNMVHAFNRYTTIYPDEIANSANDQIRQFLVPTSTNLVGPQADLNGGDWKLANPENLLNFSVVAYFMAKDIYEKYGVPIGIINASVGGTPIEAWMGENAFSEFPEIKSKILEYKDTAYVNKINREADEVRNSQLKNVPIDPGYKGDLKWYDPNYQPENWKTMTIPGYWEDQGIKNLDGVVWFRREIEVPKSMADSDAFLEMGRIIDADEFYVNGQKVGNTTYQYPPRRYSIPRGVLKEGRNVMIIRVINNSGKGGFVPDKPYYLRSNDQEIDLKGAWQYKVGAVYDRRGMDFPKSISIQNQPTSLFNAMVAPYTNFAVKGMCWYQGESNAGRPEEYARLLHAFMKDWRRQFENYDLPVIVVQLPNYMDVNYLPEESNWAELREAQASILDLDRTEVVCTIDLGEWNDIHPMRKKPVGERVALMARKLVYGESDSVASGPRVQTAFLGEGNVTLKFSAVGTGLVSRDGESLAHFAVAGENRQFYWVDAKIEENTVILDTDDMDNPKFVRYAWADNPDFANLYNNEGLPAEPFEIEIKEPGTQE